MEIFANYDIGFDEKVFDMGFDGMLIEEFLKWVSDASQCSLETSRSTSADYIMEILLGICESSRL